MYKLDRDKPATYLYPPTLCMYEQKCSDGKFHYFNEEGVEVNPNTGKVIEDEKKSNG